MRLSNALLKRSELSREPKEASLSFQAGNLLKQNSYVFYHLASAHLEKVLHAEMEAAIHPAAGKEKTEDDLMLVPFEEMDEQLLLSNVSRSIELDNTDRLATLGMRLAHLLGRDELPTARNPFRPELFVSAINDMWFEFHPDVEAHHLVLPMLQPDIFLDLSSILQEINDALAAQGILPEITDSYRIKKANTNQEADRQKESGDSAVFQQLKRLFSPNENAENHGADQFGAPLLSAGQQNQVLQAAAASNQLLGYLAGVQKNMFEHHLAGGPASEAQGATTILASIKNQTPRGTLTHVDETTIDLLTTIFDVVFRDQHIPPEIKALIGFLQVPVLKAALIDKDFFFKEEHPARRLIELLTKSGVDWDQKKGQDDPLYQTIKNNVKRVQQEFDQQITVFSDVVSDIETFIKEEETESANALSAPIAQALQQEKIVQATKAAKNDVALRIGTGEVVAFVETFLENKWVSVLTLAYSIKEEKPQVAESAVKTMDDLIWSVKPKITLQERKELIAKLPSMLAALNKWLNAVKLDDAERLQFFAELAECHAAIVRAPLELSPQRQIEIAMDVAKQAAERRLQKRANEQPESAPDEFAEKVEKLQRGTWLEFAQKDSITRKVKLAWVSPMRSLYIFTTKDKLESFSISAEELAQAFRENRTHILMVGGLVGRALTEAIEHASANDAEMPAHAAA